MSRKRIPVSHEQLTPFDLEAFVAHPAELNQRHCEAFIIPFPKAPSRWLSHYHFTPRPITFPDEGEIEGGLRWRIGATFDFSFTRSICASNYGTRGGHCYDPASLVLLEVVAKVDQYPDYASFCKDLHQQDKGRRYRQLAGLHDAITDEDDLSNFRSRAGAEAIARTMTVVVEFLRDFGLIKGAFLATDGQFEPSHSRYKGCPDACPGCQQVPLEEASRQELRCQLHNGAKRLQLTCPFPAVVAKVRQATANTGPPKEPKMALIEIEDAPPTGAATADRHQVTALLGLPEDQVPSLRLTWCHMSQGPQGQLLASGPKMPSACVSG
jgi:hypothetical protein